MGDTNNKYNIYIYYIGNKKCIGIIINLSCIM